MGKAADILSLSDFHLAILRRNLTLEVLKQSLRELKNQKEDFESIPPDPCHMGARADMMAKYADIIGDIDHLIQAIAYGDWCFNKKSTLEREKTIPEEGT